MVTVDTDEPRVAAWDRRVDWWLTGLAVAFLVAYAWQVLDDDRHPVLDTWLEVVIRATWVAFALDYVIRMTLARRRWRYFYQHLLDLAVLLLPMLRALRAVLAIGILNRQLRNDVRGRVTVFVAGAVTLVGFVAALGVLDAERDAPDAKILTFGDALWWTITTISTVGYGDLYPVTVEGRLVAGTLMVAGIALLGVVTASIAAWFVQNLRATEEQVAQDVSAEVDRTEAQLAEVLAALRSISDRLDAVERRPPSPTGSADPGPR
jgi:voltage-gated potassium channel